MARRRTAWRDPSLFTGKVAVQGWPPNCTSSTPMSWSRSGRRRARRCSGGRSGWRRTAAPSSRCRRGPYSATASR